MAKKRRRRRSGDPLLRQAQAEAQVRYGPEARALSELMSEARADLKNGIQAEEGAAAGIKAAAKAAMPELQKSYAGAGHAFDQAESDVKSALAGLGAAADSQRGVSARESAGARRRLSEALADAKKELLARQVDAEAGRAFAVRNLGQQYAGNKEKINRQKRQLAGDVGTFTQATYGDLQNAQAKLDLDTAKFELDVAGENRQARKDEADITGIDPATGKPTAAERARGKDKKKPFSREALSAHQKILGGLQDAEALVKRLRGQGLSFFEIGTVLTSPKGAKNPYGGYGPMTARAAVEIARDKRLSRSTGQRLKSRGLLMHRVPKKWRPPKKPLINW